MTNLMGMNVISHELIPPTEPKIQLSREVNVSEAFRTDYNEWLKDFFGEQNVLYVMNSRALSLAESLLEEGMERSLLGSSRPDTIMGNTLTIEKIRDSIAQLKDFE